MNIPAELKVKASNVSGRFKATISCKLLFIYLTSGVHTNMFYSKRKRHRVKTDECVSPV